MLSERNRSKFFHLKRDYLTCSNTLWQLTDGSVNFSTDPMPLGTVTFIYFVGTCKNIAGKWTSRSIEHYDMSHDNRERFPSNAPNLSATANPVCILDTLVKGLKLLLQGGICDIVTSNSISNTHTKSYYWLIGTLALYATCRILP